MTGIGRGERATSHWLRSFVRPHAGEILCVLALSFVATALALSQPYITKYLIDDGLMARRFDLLVETCGAMMLVAVANAGLGALNRWLYIRVSGRILFAIREALYRHLLTLSPTFHARTGGGELTARLDGDVGEVQRFAVDSLLALVNGSIALVISLALLVSLSWPLSLLALVLLPAEVLYLRRMRPRVEIRTRAVRERASDIMAFFFETLPAVKLIQSVGSEARETARLGRLNHAYLRELLRLQLVNFATATVPGLLTALSTATVFIAGGYMMIEGQLTLGTLIAFSAYLARATGPVQTLLGIYVASQRARVSLQRLADLLNQRPAVRARVPAVPLPPGARGEVRIEGLSFRYDAAGPETLRDLSLVIPAGRKIGIVGVSGIGKTTLIDLLQRHYDPQVGRILLDGVDLRDLDIGELRRHVAVVAQDTLLFAGTIADNIAYARPDASDAEIRDAAARAGIDDFIGTLPQGYATSVGARGATLSGGQRQRLAIARMLLQNPLVLVLDEATSAVDRETDTRIAEAIDDLFANRTRILISHHRETLASADAVFELRDGRLWALPSPALAGAVSGS